MSPSTIGLPNASPPSLHRRRDTCVPPIIFAGNTFPVPPYSYYTLLYVSDVWMVGLELDEDEMERREIEKTIRRVMEGEEGREMRRRAMELKEKVELCVNNGGSSYNSLNDLADFIQEKL
ncbi:hypothetical protein U1Q18_020796 [Sarracenia purpurea var. burkii]